MIFYSFVNTHHPRRWAAYLSNRLNALSYRWATPADAEELARMNQELIRDGADFGPDTLEFLVPRMRGWLASGTYRAVMFEDETRRTVAYALFRDGTDEIYLAQFLVLRHARGHGIGHAAIEHLRRHIWQSGKRLTLDVLVQNQPALEFWHQLGWKDCALILEIPVLHAETAVPRAVETGSAVPESRPAAGIEPHPRGTMDSPMASAA